MYHLFEHEKKERLKKLAGEFSSSGVGKVSAKLLSGKSSLAITREVIENGYDLLVRYRKGVDSRQRGLFGTTALNLLCACPCPILLVKEDHPIDTPKVLACVDIYDEALVNDNILDLARRIGGESSNPGVLFCWTIFGIDMMRRRMTPDDFEKLVTDIRTEHEADFEKFIAKYEIAAGPEAAMKFGDPEYTIAPFVSQHEIDVTVMSTIAPVGFASRLLGSTIEAVLADLSSSLLAVKPKDFVSPVKLENEAEHEDLATGSVALLT